MPRTADHESRRQQVAQALLRVIVREGLTEASLATVAKEAGVSVGLIQRYFTTKAELLDFAFTHLYDRAIERIALVPRTGTTAETAYLMLETLLPLDDERFAEVTVWVAFLAGTMPNPAAIEPHVAGMRRMHGLLMGAGLPRAEAVLLVSVVDGLSLDLVTGQGEVTPEDARACLRLAVDRAFGGET